MRVGGGWKDGVRERRLRRRGEDGVMNVTKLRAVEALIPLIVCRHYVLLEDCDNDCDNDCDESRHVDELLRNLFAGWQ